MRLLLNLLIIVGVLSSFQRSEKRKETPQRDLHISAHYSPKGAYIIWHGLSEKQTHHYRIERSQNGKTWEEISTVLPQGQESHAYNELDDEEIFIKTYYRVIEISKQGKEYVSKACAIEVPSPSRILISPKRVKRLAQLNRLLLDRDNFYIYDNDGKDFRKACRIIEKKLRVYQIDLLNLPNGEYTIVSGKHMDTFTKI